MKIGIEADGLPRWITEAEYAAVLGWLRRTGNVQRNAHGEIVGRSVSARVADSFEAQRAAGRQVLKIEGRFMPSVLATMHVHVGDAGYGDGLAELRYALHAELIDEAA